MTTEEWLAHHLARAPKLTPAQREATLKRCQAAAKRRKETEKNDKTSSMSA